MLRRSTLCCREWPSTKVTDVAVDNVDYSDPEFPPEQQHAVAYMDQQPHTDNMTETSVSPMNDNNDGGVDA